MEIRQASFVPNYPARSQFVTVMDDASAGILAGLVTDGFSSDELVVVGDESGLGTRREKLRCKNDKLYTRRKRVELP